MRAAVLEAFGQPLRITDVPDPAPADGELVVTVTACGVCHSDLHLVSGDPPIPLPRVLGHEIAGKVEGLGDVLVLTSWGCGRCRFCVRGEDALCHSGVEAGWTVDGGYAESVVVPSPRYLLPLDGLDPVRAAPLGDAGITPYRALQKARPWLDGEAELLIIGAGGLGQFAIQYAKLLTDTQVIAMDTDPRKRSRALDLGADEATSPYEPTGVRSYRAVLDFVGTDETLALAARVVERDGVVVQVGEGGGTIAFGHRVVPTEAAFRTSVAASRQEAAEVIDIARRGRVMWEVEAMPLERINEAMDRLRRGDVTGRFVVVP